MDERRRSMPVVVVEDEPIIALGLESALSDLGFEHIYTAYDLAGGHELLQCSEPSFGLLDVNIGRELVFPLAAEFSERHIPVVFSTAMPPSEFPAEWASYPILSKPTNFHELAGVLGQLGILPRGTRDM